MAFRVAFSIRTPRRLKPKDRDDLMILASDKGTGTRFGFTKQFNK